MATINANETMSNGNEIVKVNTLTLYHYRPNRELFYIEIINNFVTKNDLESNTYAQ